MTHSSSTGASLAPPLAPPEGPKARGPSDGLQGGEAEGGLTRLQVTIGCFRCFLFSGPWNWGREGGRGGSPSRENGVFPSDETPPPWNWGGGRWERGDLVNSTELVTNGTPGFCSPPTISILEGAEILRLATT